MPNFYHSQFASDLGPIELLSNDKALLHIYFSGSSKQVRNNQRITRGCSITERRIPIHVEAEAQICAYFAGQLTEFDIPYELIGTDFQRRVWQYLATITYGQTQTYAAVADGISNPKSCRAVGTAVSHNALSLLIPCHRILPKTAMGFAVGQYAGGANIKQHLLALEGAITR